MNHSDLLALVDAERFRELFIEQLGWLNPDRPDLRVTVDGKVYELTQVAGYKGLRIWNHKGLPPRRVQRAIDVEVGRDSTERLIIFSGAPRQDWRWPRRAQLGSTNAKLVVHEHRVGVAQPDLDSRLRAISIDLDDDITLVELLQKMRDAFDRETESASVQAARLMNVLYAELAAAEVPPVDATLTLARLLFLMFGDDTDMWRTGKFANFLEAHTTPGTLHDDLDSLFDVVDKPAEERTLLASSPLGSFRYINGGLYAAPLNLPQLTSAFRDGLIEATKFDWGLISPAIFGSMFQTVKGREERRAGGEHYTTEENILKTIRPLFLDDLHARLEAAWDDKAQLTKLHNTIGRLRVLDPACGCGNFLVVAYRELRALELELVKRRRDLDEADGRRTGRNLSQTTFDVTGDIKVTLDHFFGIEAEEWPARIAETAMLLVDHLANQQMEEEFGVAPDRLPIRLAPTIRHGNAIRTDWREVLSLAPAESVDDLIVVGNPPFVGMAWLTAAQQEDNRIAFAPFAGLRTGRLDYVACWYAKTIELLRGSKGRAAFVSTNSITQGEQARTMVPLLERTGFKVDFGHRTFKWTSEAASAAVVYVVIVGFSTLDRPTAPRLFDYPSVAGEPVELLVNRLNFYLVDGPNLAPVKVAAPLVAGMPMASKGSQPTDNKGLIVSEEQREEVEADPIARKYLRRFFQTREMLNDLPRWCLWMVGADLAQLRKSKLLRERLEIVWEARLDSPTESVKRQASTPHLFTQIRQPTKRYLALPEVSSENREWIPGSFLEPDVIAGNKLIVWNTEQLWHFGYLQSSMYMAWIRTYSGRWKSDFSLSPGLVYFPFPFLIPSQPDRTAIEVAAQAVLDERARRAGATLAELYDRDDMPRHLREAHYRLDGQIDGLYGLEAPTEAERMKEILQRYEALTAPLAGGRRAAPRRKRSS